MVCRARPVLVALIAALALALLTLLAYTLLVAYPEIASIGSSRLQHWIGSGGVRVGYLMLGALIAGAYVWVAVRGTSDAEPVFPPWLAGAPLGAVAGVVVVLGARSYEIAFVTPFVAGALAVWVSRDGSAGPLAGFWCAMALALVHMVGGLASDLLQASRLVHTAWVGDPTCGGATGTLLAACEIGDKLGGRTFLLLVMPAVGAGLGVVGGILGAAVRALQRAGLPDTPRWSPAVAAPATFAVAMLALLSVELVGRLW